MIVVDTGPLYAAADASDDHRTDCARLFERPPDQLVVPIGVVVETSFLIERHLGPEAEAGFLKSIQRATLVIDRLLNEDLERIADLVTTYADLPLGTVDASVVAAAERLNAITLFSLDRRHFTIVRPRHTQAFTLIPWEWSETLEGTPQGASVSTLLCNVYLHYVFDLWARQWRQRHARGDVVVVRFADDLVVCFQHRDDAERFWADLRERFAEFGLELNDDKTRLIEFGRFADQNREERGLGKPETFDFLGLTHICARNRHGRFKLRRVTSKKRMRAKLHAVKAELRRRMHLPIPEQGVWLARVVQGHLNYYAVPDNTHALRAFVNGVIRHWLRTLRRRSQRCRMTWQRMRRYIDRWIPRPRILHPWPSAHLNAKTQGRSPVRFAP